MEDDDKTVAALEPIKAFVTGMLAESNEYRAVHELVGVNSEIEQVVARIAYLDAFEDGETQKEANRARKKFRLLHQRKVDLLRIIHAYECADKTLNRQRSQALWESASTELIAKNGPKEGPQEEPDQLYFEEELDGLR